MVVVSLMKLPMSLQDQTQPPWISADGYREREREREREKQETKAAKGREVNRLLFKERLKRNEGAASEGNRKSMERPERHRSITIIPNFRERDSASFTDQCIQWKGEGQRRESKAAKAG